MKIFWFLQAGGDQFSSAETRLTLRRSRWLLLLIFVTLVSFIGWSYWAEIDQITRAPGAVIASSRTQIVQSQEGGILQQLEVREGDKVERGQVLARLERTQAETAYLESLAKKAALLAASGRLRKEVFGGEFEFDPLLQQYPGFVTNQTELFNKRQSAINEEILALQKMASLVNDELNLNRPLLETGDVSLADVLRLERQLADLESQMTNVRNQYFRDAQAELNKLEEELAGVEQQLAQRKDKLDQTVLYAPVNGIVKNIAITTEGGVLRPGEELLQIVPIDDALIIEAKVPPSDIAFVHTGLPATVKIDAYDYTIYGDLEGVLTYISADTLQEQRQSDEQPYYRIQVKTNGRRFNGALNKELEILPGMTAMVEVKTGSNTVLSYITKPLVKTLAESMGER